LNLAGFLNNASPFVLLVNLKEKRGGFDQ